MTGRALALLAIATAFGAAVACSSSTEGSSSTSSSSGSSGDPTCPNDLPSACPTPEPSYANDVAPLISRVCRNCHIQGGLNQDQLFGTYTQVHAQRIEILTQVSSCRMPPADAGTLSSADRQTLLGWLVCGAKDN